MRIFFLCNEDPPGPHGGIGTMTQLLGRALVRSGHVVRVVASVYPLIAVGLLTSSRGEALGYALGIGDASRSLGNYEFHRERHLRRRRPRP